MATTTPAKPRQSTRPIFARPRRLPFPLNLYQSAVGKKWVMGVTGIMLMGYVLVHMIGNLHMYEGPEKFNEYGEALRDLGGNLAPRTFVLWLLRIGLTAAFVLHIHAAYALTRVNQKARTAKYRGGRTYHAATFASRTMRWSGIIILLYLFFHLADLTWGWWLGDDYIRGDVYNNVVRSLSSAPIALVYIVANVVLGVHLYHGGWSLFQSLGLNNPRFNQARRSFATAFAAIIVIGNLSFPIAAVTGLVSQDNRTYECHDGSDSCLGENN